MRTTIDAEGARTAGGAGLAANRAGSLRDASDRVEQLIDELRSSTAPATWARIEALVSALTAVYGGGLARIVDALSTEGATLEQARAQVHGDPWVESLLIRHGLHPLTLEERIHRAVDRVRSAIGAGAGPVEVVPSKEGVPTVRLTGDWRRCPLGASSVEAALLRAFEESAPDAGKIAIESLAAFPEPRPGLAQIDPGPSRGRP